MAGVPAHSTVDPELAVEVLRSNTVLINKSAIDVSDLAESLFEKDIINEKEKKEAANKLWPDEERLSTLMDIVRATVSGNGEVFTEFLEILSKGKRSEKDLADKLKRCYDEMAREQLGLIKEKQMKVKIDLDKLKQVIKNVVTENYAKLTDFPKDNLPTLAAKLFELKIISRPVKNDPSYNSIIGEFEGGLMFISSFIEIKEHCRNFLSGLKFVGGGLANAAETLKQSWNAAIQRKWGVGFLND